MAEPRELIDALDRAPEDVTRRVRALANLEPNEVEYIVGDLIGLPDELVAVAKRMLAQWESLSVYERVAGLMYLACVLAAACGPGSRSHPGSGPPLAEATQSLPPRAPEVELRTAPPTPARLRRSGTPVTLASPQLQSNPGHFKHQHPGQQGYRWNQE